MQNYAQSSVMPLNVPFFSFRLSLKKRELIVKRTIKLIDCEFFSLSYNISAVFSFFFVVPQNFIIYIFFFWAERQKLLLLLYFFAVKHVLLALTHGYNNALLVNVFEQLILIRKKNLEHGMKVSIVFRKKFLNLFWL